MILVSVCFVSGSLPVVVKRYFIFTDLIPAIGGLLCLHGGRDKLQDFLPGVEGRTGTGFPLRFRRDVREKNFIQVLPKTALRSSTA